MVPWRTVVANQGPILDEDDGDWMRTMVMMTVWQTVKSQQSDGDGEKVKRVNNFLMCT